MKKHASYGMIGAARWTGSSTRLFGSNLPGHSSGITVTIKSAEVVSYDRGHEHIHARETIAQVNLSAVQWAEFLTTLNVGEGVPCTVTFVTGDTQEYRDAPPERPSEPERVREEFSVGLRTSIDNIAAARATAARKLQGKVSAALAKEIDNAFGGAEQELRSNAPWYVKRFTEATDRVAQSVKAELDAFLTTTAHRLGMKALQDAQQGDDGAPRKIT